MVHRAKLPSFRLFISPSRLTAALEPGQNIHLPLPKKKQKRASKWLDFFVNVWFWSTLDLTLNQRVRSWSLRRLTKTYLMTRLRTLGRTDSLTLLLLCQNYMTLCVRIGKIDRLRPPLKA